MSEKNKEINRESITAHLKLTKQKSVGLVGRINETEKILVELRVELMKLEGEKRAFERILNG